MKELLSIDALTQKFGGLTAVQNVDLHVNAGEIIGLIGPNGAGKTTIFNVITGIYAPTAGRVLFEGREISGKAIHKIAQAGIGRTFQNIRLFSKLTVLENIQVAMNDSTHYGLLESVLHAGRYRREEVRTHTESMALLEAKGLSSFSSSASGSLPYGIQRRLEIVRAMATRARLLLLDEPAAGMNEKETQELSTFIRSLPGQGYSVLLIEHDMKLVMNICDRIYVLNYGKCIAAGVPEAIRTNEQVINAYLGE